MATLPIDDGKPTHWSLKGGRHNALSRHRGSHGLWYLIGIWGQGRYKDEWSIMVFPDSVRVGCYEGDRYSRIVTESLSSFCLLSLEGKGGHDYGKSAGSKGGYREGGDISYSYAGKGFDPALLQDGDEFLKKVLGYEPTVEGIREGLTRDARLAAEKKAAEEERDRQWRAQREAERADYERRLEEQKAIFTDLAEPPAKWNQAVEADGLHVWERQGVGYDRWGEKIHHTMAEYQQWYETEMADQVKREQARQEYEVAEVLRIAKQEAGTANVLSQKQKMAERLKALKK